MSHRMCVLVVAASLALLGCDPASQTGADAASSAPMVDISAETFLASPPAGALVLDVRSPAEYASGHVPSARNIPHDELADRLAELEGAKDRPVVVYCERGGRAKVAAATLREAGYTNLLHIEGDMSGWREAGRPSEGGVSNAPQG